MKLLNVLGISTLCLLYLTGGESFSLADKVTVYDYVDVEVNPSDIRNDRVLDYEDLELGTLDIRNDRVLDYEDLELGTLDINYKTCGEQITQNNSYFVNPEYPAVTSTGMLCQLTLGNLTNNTCQLRLEFPSFVLGDPSLSGICDSDYFSIQGLGYPVSDICGYNSDQHLYIDINPAIPPTFLVNLDSARVEDRLFSIKVIQIPCDSPARAPSGCLQYFTAPSGLVQSFNFPFNPQLSFDQAVTKQTSNQQYSTCIRPEKGYCSITWSADQNNVPYYFFVNGESPTIPLEYIGTLTVANYGDRCWEDYVLIPGGSFTNISGYLDQADRFCGAGFPITVTSSFRPFQLYVKTDNNEVVDKGNFGFSLHFTQNLC